MSLELLMDVIVLVQDELHRHEVDAGAGDINCWGTVNACALKVTKLVGKFVGGAG